MRKIDHVVFHHGAGADYDMDQALKVYQDTHHKNLYKTYNQPRIPHSKYPDIAYHIIVAKDKWDIVRPFEIEAYHASDRRINRRSLGICITGNYDNQTLSQEKYTMLCQAIAYIKHNYPAVTTWSCHRKYANKTCPGINITDHLLKKAWNGEPMPSDTKRSKQMIAEVVEVLDRYPKEGVNIKKALVQAMLQHVKSQK